MPHWKKSTSQKGEFGSNKTARPKMNYEGNGKQFRKKIQSEKLEKNSQNQREIAHVNKKPPVRKQIFAQTPFSHSTSK